MRLGRVLLQAIVSNSHVLEALLGGLDLKDLDRLIAHANAERYERDRDFERKAQARADTTLRGYDV